MSVSHANRLSYRVSGVGYGRTVDSTSLSSIYRCPSGADMPRARHWNIMPQIHYTRFPVTSPYRHGCCGLVSDTANKSVTSWQQVVVINQSIKSNLYSASYTNSGRRRLTIKQYKKLSYRRETARQLPTWSEGGARPSSPLPSAPSGYTYAYG